MSNNNNFVSIELLDSSNNILSGVGGPLTSVTQYQHQRKLSSIGQISFDIPLAERKAKFLDAGVRLSVRDEILGFVGIFLFANSEIASNGNNSMLRCLAYDQLQELTFQSVHFFRNYSDETVADVINDLMSNFPSWQTEIEDNLGNISISFQGQSYLSAITEICKLKGLDYRLRYDQSTLTPVLEVGNFGELNNIFIDQFSGQVTADFEQATNNAIITNLSLSKESTEIYNRIIPLAGNGQGLAALTLEQASGIGAYAVQSDTNPDGSSFYYIQDDDSKDKYGLRERIVTFNEIRPITMSEANITNAANILNLSAEQFLLRHLEPVREYDVSLVGVRKDIAVGDKVHLRYNESVGTRNTLNVDEDFFVLQNILNRSANGARTNSLGVANSKQKAITDQSVIIDVVRDLRDLNIQIPATICYAPVGPYTKRIKGSFTTPSSRISPIFYVRIQEEVLYLNRALLRFRTSPLKSSVTTTASGGLHRHLMLQSVLFTDPVQNNANLRGMLNAGGTAVGTIQVDWVNAQSDAGPSTLYTYDADGTHTHDMDYGVFLDTIYPREIWIRINGTDRTLALGGPFDNGNDEISEELDITEYLIADGVRQIHEIEFRSELDTSGEIEFECDLMVTSMPIRVS